jgi:hypothetical protein
MRSNAARLLPEFREFQRRNGAPSHYRHLAITSRATPQRRPGAAIAATPGVTQARSAAGSRRATDPARRGADVADRATDLSALSSRAADLHPQAHAKTGDGTMICSTHLRRRPPLLPPRATGTLSRATVTNATDAPHLGQNNAANHPQKVDPDGNAAIASLRLGRTSHDDRSGYRASSLKSP